MKRLPIYFDNAATTQLSEEVLKEMLPYFREFYGNASSRHHAHGWLAEEAVDNAKKEISESLKCGAKSIIFTSGATESINLVLKGFFENNKNYKLITSVAEHKGTIDTVNYLAKKGIETEFLSVNNQGEIDLNILEGSLKRGLALVSLLWINNETGVITDIDKIAALTKKHGALLHVDATQSVGKIPFDFKESGVDFLSFSGHKIYGPKGIGALIVKNEKHISPQIIGGGQQRGLRSGTLNVPLIVGLGKATNMAINDLSENVKKLENLREIFENGLLTKIKNIEINGVKAKRAAYISNVYFENIDGEELMQKLPNLAISNGSACSSASTLPSHVLTAMGRSEGQAFGCLRFSFGVNNTETEVEKALEDISSLF